MRVSVNFYLTWQCNFRCAHCIHECGPYGKHMTREEIDFGMKFVQWLKTQNSLPAVIGLTGGEPMLHPNLWTDVMPNLEAIKMQYKTLQVEMHTNGSRPVPLAKRLQYHKFFATIYVGHDMFHREFRQINELFLDDYTDLGPITLRSNKWLLKKEGSHVLAASVRMKGRGINTLKSEKYHEVYVSNYPRQECFRAEGDGILVNFTPGLINHCGEKAHPLADGTDITDYSAYTDTFSSILRNAIDYQLVKCGANCSQKCMVSLISKTKDLV